MTALAVHVVARFGSTAGELAPALESMLTEPPPSRVKPGAVFNALRNIGPPGLQTLVQELQSGDANNLVLQAVASFGERGSLAVPFVKQYLSSKEPAVRTAAIGALRASRVKLIMYSDAVFPLLVDTDADIRFQAASVLLDSNDNGVVHVAEAALRELVGNEKEQIRLAAIEKIQERGIRLSDHETTIVSSIATDGYLSRLLEEVQGEFYDEYFKTCMSGPIFSLPSFPWPPPQFSERDVIPRTFLGADTSPLTQIDERLDSALETAGYGRTGLFSIQGGFVRVTRLERVNASLAPLSGEYRWTEAPIPPRNLRDYLGQLFLEKPGVFRFIVFAVTDKWAEPSSTKIRFEQARVLFLRGALVLPDEYRKIKFAGRQCYVLVYEFQKVTGRTWQVIPSPVNAKSQLMGAGVWSVLARR